MKEGVIRFDLEFVVADAPDPNILLPLDHWRNELRKRNLIGRDPARYDGLSYGNVSCRLPPYDASPGRRPFAITASQTSWKRTLTPEQYSTVLTYDLRAHRLQCSGKLPASSESLTHAALYDSNPWIRAVFHVHDARLWHRYQALLPCADNHAENGTLAMTQEVQRLSKEGAFADFPGFIMRGHQDGLCVFGRSVDEAGKKLLELVNNP